MNGSSSNSENAPGREHSDANKPEAIPDQQQLFENVLNSTFSDPDAHAVRQAIVKARADSPEADYTDPEVLTRFVVYLLREKLGAEAISSSTLLSMASTVAQTLLEDPEAKIRLSRLWLQFNV
ncbi:MAG: hypothetical protein COA78_08400 [Blastopirellula sp.]|nr:MAG: hypothetical protein COA78_08400 [Blastopirellula sp.]